MNFVAPVWLYAIPAALLVLWFIYHAAAHARRKLLGNFAADRLLSELLRTFSPARRRFKQLLLAVAIGALMLALARPEHGYTWQDTQARGIDVLFVLDSSKSMLAQDIRPNRLERSKFAILDFIDRLEGDRIGLVAFAGNAFLQCPLTLDYDAFRLSLEAVDTNVIPHGGTDIARALMEAENAFNEDNNHKIIVLITDGEDLEESGIEQAREAAGRGVTIYTVGVGTAEGQLIPVKDQRGRVEYLRDSDGRPVTTQLDEETLNDIAEVTNGFYVPLGNAGFGLEQVYEAGLSAIPEQELGTRRQKIGIERFQWPLAVAIFLLMWEPLVGTRRGSTRRNRTAAAGSTVAALFAAIILLPAESHAQTNAAALYRSGDYEAAANAYEAALSTTPENAELHYNLGNSLYSQGNYEAAVEAYTNALGALDLMLQADAFYNMANARYLMGKAALAGAAPDEQITQGNEQAREQYTQAMSTGNGILRRAEANRTPAALRNPQAQAEVVPQQEIQQAIQMAEQAKENNTSAKDLSESTAATGDRGVENWRQAVKDYNSSLELEPASDDASYNLSVVEQKLALRRQQDATFREEAERLGENVEALEMLIEELKKLLEQQENENQQDQNQNQDNQDQQQDQQQQNQDNQQQQDQQNQQDQQQQQEQQSDQQSSSDQSQQQNQEQSQQQNEQQNQGGQQNEQEQDQQQQDGESGQQDQQEDGQQNEQDQSAEEQQPDNGQPENQGSEGEQPERNADEQQGDEQSERETDQGQENEEQGEQESQEQQQNQSTPAGNDGQQQEGDTQEQQPGAPLPQMSEEELKELAEQMAAEQAGKEGGEEKGAAAAGQEKPRQDIPRVPGVMSREEARRLLDSLKKDDKKLPSIYIPRRYNVDDEGKRKDW